MTQQEFIENKRRIHTAIRSLEKEWKDYVEAYTKENNPFKIGDKIEVVYNYKNKPNKVQVGYVFEVHASYDGRIMPKLHGVKKDGTEHKNKQIWIDWPFMTNLYIIREDGSRDEVTSFIHAIDVDYEILTM